MLSSILICALTVFGCALHESRTVDGVTCAGLGEFSRQPPFDHLPEPECIDTEHPVTFSLYTRNGQTEPSSVGPVIDKDGLVPNDYDGHLDTVFIVHGFKHGGSTPWVLRMKDQFLLHRAVNVIVMDWGHYARRKIVSKDFGYSRAASNTRVVGALLAQLAGNLTTKGGATYNWCVGHSLGAHVCGQSGRYVQDIPSRKRLWNRITGLDPAGPKFENRPTAGLNHDCAEFVDVIHTAGDVTWSPGMMETRGDLDFYPNDGRKQPGCKGIQKREIHPRKRRGLIGKLLGCSHSRAHRYFTESINSECFFNATCSCHNTGDIPGSCKLLNRTELPSMGYHASQEFKGIYTLGTNGNSPYCQNSSLQNFCDAKTGYRKSNGAILESYFYVNAIITSVLSRLSV